MGRVWQHAARAAAGWLVAASLLAAPAPALAHKLYVFAQVEQGAIRGRAYFPGDVPAQKCEVIARDPAGHELDRTVTDADGKFTCAVRERVDYCLVAETADGHSGQCIVHAAELPDKLAANAANPAVGAAAPNSSANIRHIVRAAELPDMLGDNTAKPAAGAAATRSSANIPPPAEEKTSSPSAAAPEPPADIGTQLEELRKQVQELRRQLFESDERLRFRDILGGVGFILGMAGVGFYMKSRRRVGPTRS